MADNTIQIDVRNTITNAEQVASTQEQGGLNWSGISAQFAIRAGRQLISATGNTQVSQVLQKATQYGFGVARIIASGGTDVAAMAGLALNLANDAMRKANENARKLAKSQNEIDLARMNAGLLDMSDVTSIKTHWWSGRYKYGRG